MAPISRARRRPPLAASTEVGGERPSTGGRRRSSLVLAVAGIAAVLVGTAAWLASDSDRSDVAADRTPPPATDLAPATDLEPARELYGAGVTAVGDEVWVFGGVSGPDGSSPPSTSMLPDRWGANDLVTVYGPDAQVRAQYRLPGTTDRALTGGQVFARGDERYLVSSYCNGFVLSAGCADTYEPALFRFDAEQGTVSSISLSLPELDPSDEIGPGFVQSLGIDDDGHLWVSQWIPNTSPLLVTSARLLRIDPVSGAGTAVPLPDGHVDLDALCMRGGSVYVAYAELGATRAEKVTIVRRPATAEPGAWDVVAEPTPDLTMVHGASLACLGFGEITLLLDRSPTVEMITVSDDGRSPPEQRSVPGHRFRLVGEIDGASVFAGLVERDGTTTEDQMLLVRGAGEWTESGTTLSRDARPVVVDGALRDASPLLTSTRPGAATLAPIEL